MTAPQPEESSTDEPASEENDQPNSEAYPGQGGHDPGREEHGDHAARHGDSGSGDGRDRGRKVVRHVLVSMVIGLVYPAIALSQRSVEDHSSGSAVDDGSPRRGRSWKPQRVG
jgi:hypothetical protein